MEAAKATARWMRHVAELSWAREQTPISMMAEDQLVLVLGGEETAGESAVLERHANPLFPLLGSPLQGISRPW